MSYQEVLQQYRDEVEERYPLVMERIAQIETEETVLEPYRSYFRHAARFLQEIKKEEAALTSGQADSRTLAEWQQINRALYEEILPENYEKSYANPTYAVEALGETFGKMLSALYADIRSLIPCAYQGRVYEITIFAELLVEIYNCFEEEEVPEEKEIQQIIYWFNHDYGELFMEMSVLALTSPELDFVTGIIMNSDLEDLSYLYRYGYYITENERKTAEFLNSLPQEQIQAMADTYTEGYRIGFEVTGKDLSKKSM